MDMRRLGADRMVVARSSTVGPDHSVVDRSVGRTDVVGSDHSVVDRSAGRTGFVGSDRGAIGDYMLTPIGRAIGDYMLTLIGRAIGDADTRPHYQFSGFFQRCNSSSIGMSTTSRCSR